VNSLSPGSVACLRGGSYGPLPDCVGCWNHFTVNGTSASRITVRSYPGELATIRGYTAVDSNYLTFTTLKFDGANSAGNSANGTCSGPRAVGVDVAGSNNLFDRVEVFSSLAGYMESGFLVRGNNNEIRYSKIHDPLGCWLGHDHGLYVGGIGNQVHHNWIYGFGGYGWGVQLYPGPSQAHVYANVIDGAGSGLVNCSTGSNNLMENNVVTNSTGTFQVPGSLIDGCPPSGSGHVVQNNDQINNPGGFGACNSPPAGETCSGNISIDPQYVDRANHNYTVQNPTLAGYGLPTAADVGP
jgi:hypothetical protein